MIYSFTDKAEKDLERILDFTLIHWGQRKAIEYLNGIELLAVKLSENPSIGIERPELATSN